MGRNRSKKMLAFLREELGALRIDRSSHWNTKQHKLNATGNNRRLVSADDLDTNFGETDDVLSDADEIAKEPVDIVPSEKLKVSKWLLRKPVANGKVPGAELNQIPQLINRRPPRRYSESNVTNSRRSSVISSGDSDVFLERRESVHNTLSLLEGKGNPKKSKINPPWRDGSNDELKVMQGTTGKRGSLTSRLVTKASRRRSTIKSARSYGSLPADLNSIIEQPVIKEEDHIANNTADDNLSVISGSSRDGNTSRATGKSRRNSVASIGSDKQITGGRVTSLATVTLLKKKMRRRRMSLRSNSESEPAASGARGRHRKRVIHLLEKFKRICRLFILLYRIWKIHSRRIVDVLANFDSINIMMDQRDDRQDLLFDISEYKAHKEARLSQETRRILQKKPRIRTEEELHYLRIALRNYSSIVEYPVHMQKMIAERAWYEGFDMKKVIVREGHWPFHFYFLLSGSVIVSSFDKEAQINKTVCLLNRGDSFGELSIINRSRRQTTVISKQKVELLVLDDESFLEIFMSGGLGNPRDPFLTSVFCLKHWPLELLGTNPKKAMFSFFKRGTVLTSDSTKSEWIYIVKSGSCAVLKKLSKEVPVAVQSTRLKNGVYWRGVQAEEEIPHQKMLEASFEREVEELESTSYWLRQAAHIDINIATEESYTTHGKKDLTDSKSMRDFVASPHVQSGQGIRKSISLSGPFLTKTNQNPNPPSGNIKDEERRGSHKDDTKPDEHVAPETEDDRSQFISVQTLTKGSVFGLADLLIGNQPCFSLVSNGAEIIMVNKKFYIENANEHLMAILREQIYPFPTNADLQEDLKRTVNWEFNRAQAMKNILRRLRLCHSDVHDARSTLWLSQC